MPDCRSGAVHSLVCGTIIYMAVAGDIGVCHADCHEGVAAKLSGMRGAEVLKAPGYAQERETAKAGVFEQGCVSDSKDQTSWKPKARQLF